MHVLRAEKGFIIVGQDTDGSVTPEDIGMEWRSPAANHSALSANAAWQEKTVSVSRGNDWSACFR